MEINIRNVWDSRSLLYIHEVKHFIPHTLYIYAVVYATNKNTMKNIIILTYIQFLNKFQYSNTHTHPQTLTKT